MRHNKSGFTLTELLVVISIFAVIFVLSLVNFRRGERLQQLRLATEKMASDFRSIQTSVMTGSNTTVAEFANQGIFIDLATPQKYVIFLDGNGDKKYDSANVNDKILETVDLPSEVSITAIKDGNGVSSDKLNAVFEPPKPTLNLNYLDPVTTMPNEILVEIGRSDITSVYYKVSLKRILGRISFQQFSR